jgi:hypothetical protein
MDHEEPNQGHTGNAAATETMQHDVRLEVVKALESIRVLCCCPGAGRGGASEGWRGLASWPATTNDWLRRWQDFIGHLRLILGRGI